MPDPLLTALLLALVAVAAATRVPWRRLLRRVPLPRRVPAPVRPGRSGRTPGPVRIAWEATGRGPAVLLVHGLGYGRWGWEPIVERLADRFEVVTVDNRGIGDSDAPAGPYRTRVMAADLVAVLDDAGIDRATVVGTSLGGMIAQELALHWPDRVDRLVLAATIPGGVRTVPMPPYGAVTLAEAPYRSEAARARAAVKLALSPATIAGRPEVAARLAEVRAANPLRRGVWAAQASAGIAFDPRGAQRDLPHPTLIIQGTADQVVNPGNGRALAGLLPDATLVEVEGAGHLLFWERPAELADLVAGFAAKAHGRRPGRVVARTR